MNYTFSTLNDKDFEQIVRDLLNTKFNLELQSFKIGRDKGIDLRFSTSKNNNSLIVQAKHYINSGFAQLKYTLKEKELSKIKVLKPDRYIVVTSLPLSATEKDELKDILSPFVLTSNDIIGQEDLNGYLAEYREVEIRYFKLWFSSVNVFNSVLNNAIEGRTKSALELIANKVPFYVITKKLDEANKILQKEKLLLITGQPGIGKTTLAEIILFERAKNGYKIYKVTNIKEAEDVISQNKDDKQLFYFDDFLGEVYYEITNAHKTETQLTYFVERIKNTPNKYLILTTRTVILNQAIEQSEKINRSKLISQQFELRLTDYNKYEKALILYNHIYFRKIGKLLHNGILKDKFYKTIIEHKNYTPRIIEFITEKSRIDKFNSIEYRQFIVNNLNNPKEIWAYSFNMQIGYMERCLLVTLFSFEYSVSEKELIKAFDERLAFEKREHNQIINSNQFNDSIKMLLNGFIASVIREEDQKPVRYYSFINPSLTDFLIGYVSESFSERKSMISSITFSNQLDRFDPEKSIIPLEKELQLIIRDKISNSELTVLLHSVYSNNANKINAILLECLCRYCNEVNIDVILLKLFNEIDFGEKKYNLFLQLSYVLLNIGDAPQTISFIKNNFITIIERLMVHIDEKDDALQIPQFFEKFEQDYSLYSDSDTGFDNIVNLVGNVLRNNEDELKRERKNQIEKMEEVNELYEEISSLQEDLEHELFPDTRFVSDYGIDIDQIYWNEKIAENLDNTSSKVTYDYTHHKENVFDLNEEDKAIEDLFSKS